MSQSAHRDGCVTRWSRAVGSCSWRSRASEPAGGRGRLRRESCYRLPAVAPLPGGRLGGAAGPTAGAEAAAAPLVGRRGGGDPRGAFVRQCWPCDRGGVARPAGVDCLEGASPLRRLETAAPTPESRCSVTSGSGRASSSMSTSRNWAASGRSGRRSSATGSRAVRAPAGSTCTSRSTTTHGWPTASCSRQRAHPTASPSSAAHTPGTPVRASRSNAFSATTATAHRDPAPGQPPVAELCNPAPRTRRAGVARQIPTAKPKRSSSTRPARMGLSLRRTRSKRPTRARASGTAATLPLGTTSEADQRAAHSDAADRPIEPRLTGLCATPQLAQRRTRCVRAQLRGLHDLDSAITLVQTSRFVSLRRGRLPRRAFSSSTYGYASLVEERAIRCSPARLVRAVIVRRYRRRRPPRIYFDCLVRSCGTMQSSGRWPIDEHAGDDTRADHGRRCGHASCPSTRAS